MGRLLKEALKCLCGENRWSYAVFWKIGHRNPALLVWEDYHYESARYSTLPAISGIESTEMLLQEWEGLWNSTESRLPKLGYQTEDKVIQLINKMMITNQVQVVGEGIVGRAAFMGLHQWILQETCMVEGFPSEVLAEVNHQFSAGMQTVAVIPVLPHGVVQLGSTMAVVENMGFVNDVKCLFAQLGGVPGALLSDSYTTKDTGPKFGASTLHGEPISAVISRHPSFQESRFTPISNVCFNQQNSAFHASGIGSQPSPSVAQIQDNRQMQTNPRTPTMPTNPCTPTMSKSLRDLFQMKNLPIMQPNLPFGGPLEARETGAHVILSSSDARLNQQASPNHPSFRSNNQFSESNSSCSSVTRVGKQIVSGVGLRGHASDILPASVNNSGSPIRSKGGTVPNSGKDSILVSLLGGRLESNPPYQPLKGLQCDLPSSAMRSSSDHSNWSNNRDALPGLPLQGHLSTDDNHNDQTKWTAGNQMIENDVFQSLSILPSQSDEDISMGRPMPGFLSDSWVNSSEHNKKRSTSCNIICEDAYVKPPSGEDLFDILGIDPKSGKHCGSWNSSLIHGADSDNRSASIDISKCITQIDEGPGCYAVNDSISESGIFSETASDHLLDAVVSKVHSGTKQMIDDDISCWTTLSKISSSSVATGSQSCGQVSVSDHKQGKFGGLPSTLVKAPKVGSSSFKSGCTKDNAGETSQISSMYGSQVSLAAEDSQNVKHDNSISTAHSKRPLEVGKANRKRLKPGDSPRPRPKDRQMIQDRVKELREIVPNGAKCSIDALLERTIKHMLFLQSVTKHADKLKQTGESKIINEEGGLLLKDNFEGGATWAYEVGSQSMVCPIIVEDLNLPGQMLVEMLCEERGLFLEIADIIRGLGLTILKGVMEAHDDKVWVRFTVEANRDVTRMEIFMALVHLLEQAGKSSTSSSKGIAAGNMPAQGTSVQASIPATGQSVNLQ